MKKFNISRIKMNNTSYNEGRKKGKNVSLSNPIKGRGQRQIGM